MAKIYLSMILVLFLLARPCAAATDAPPLPDAATLAEHAENRFPQPVRVGDLIGRQVLEPTEAQHVLGRVESVTKKADGGTDLVVAFGGIFGFDSRPIAVPIDAVGLLGEYVAVLDFTPAQLRTFPTIKSQDLKKLPADDTIKVGIVRPFH